jgi:hypothetical protein
VGGGEADLPAGDWSNYTMYSNSDTNLLPLIFYSIFCSKFRFFFFLQCEAVFEAVSKETFQERHLS